MSRFSTTTEGDGKTINKAGEPAYTLPPDLELYQRVCTSLLYNRFYETAREEVERIRELLEEVDPEFAWKLASYTRNEMHLRTIPVVLAVELTKLGHGNRDGVSSIIQRPDEIVELLGFYNVVNGLEEREVTPLANSIKRGVQDVFEDVRFDEYQWAKWNRSKRAIRIKDAMFVARPEPQNDEQEELFRKIADDDLEPPETWEVGMAQAEQDGTPKRDVWHRLIDDGKLPYFAALKNLVTMMRDTVDREHFVKLGDMISDEGRVRGSRVLPFRFFTAYKMVQQETHPAKKVILKSLEDAATIASENIPHFDASDSVVIATDTSGSMQSPISPKSMMRQVDIGLLMSNLLANKCDWVRHVRFDTDVGVLPMVPDKPLESAASYRPRGGATNGHLVVDKMLQEGWDVDKVFVFSDMQLWNTDQGFRGRGGTKGQGSFAKAWREYRKHNPDVEAYLFDLNGYGDAPLDVLGGDNAHLLSGWSTEVFRVLENIEEGGDALDRIKKVNL